MAPHRRLARLPGAAVIALAGVLALTACTGNEPPPTRAVHQVHFTHKQPFVFGAQGPVVIDSRGTAAGDPRRIDHLMPLAPDAAIRTWAAERVQATGTGPHTVRVVIRDASARETALPVKDGVKGFFTADQEAKYDVSQEVAVQVVDGAGTVLVSATGQVRRARSIDEKATEADRQALWFRLVEETTRDLDEQLDLGMRSYMASYLVQ